MVGCCLRARRPRHPPGVINKLYVRAHELVVRAARDGTRDAQRSGKQALLLTVGQPAHLREQAVYRFVLLQLRDDQAV